MDYRGYVSKTVMLLSCVVFISGCSSSACSNNNTPTTTSNIITIDNAGVIPVFGSSSTSTVIYVHNNGTAAISGINYSVELNDTPAKNTQSNKLTKKTLSNLSGNQCSSIAAGQSCPLSITTPVLSGSNTQGSMLIKASYQVDGKTANFNQVLNYATVQNNTTDGAKFQSGVDISGYGNKTGYATIYLYGSGNSNIYDVSSMTINKPSVQIVNGNLSGHQIQSNFVQAVEVSAPVLSSSVSAKITVVSSLANTQLKQNQKQLTGQISQFVNSADIGVEPIAAGAILTTGLVPLINTVNSTSGSMLVQNAGNQDAILGSVSAGTGITLLSGCSGVTLAPAASCTINFTVTESGGSANITIPYSGGSANTIAGNVTWFNGVGAALVSMSASNNPMTFAATVGGSTTVSVTNIGGYTLNNVSIPTPVVISGSATATLSNDTCTGNSLAIGDSCSYQVALADNATDLNQQINLGFTANYAGTTGTQSYSRLMPVTYSSTAYGAIVAIDPTAPSITISGNNYESTTQTLTLSNNGNLPATITPSLTNAPAYLTESTTTCGATLNAESSCNITLQFGPTFNASSTNGTAVYQVNYTAAGQTPSGVVTSEIAWTVQGYAQSISLTDHSALGATSGNGESLNTQYNFTARGRDQVVTKSITLTYTNTGTNPMKIMGIQDSNSAYTWKIGGDGTTCIAGTTTLAPNDTCKIVYDNVFESNILALRSVGATYSENLILPTLIYQDATNANIQFSATPNLPTGGTTLYAQSNQATLANIVTVNESGNLNESVTVSHLLANASGYGDITVTTKMEDYFVSLVGTPSACSSNSTDGIMTQTCTLSANQLTGSMTYQVSQTLLNESTDVFLTTIFSNNAANGGLIVSMNPLSIVSNLGVILPCNPCSIFVTNNTYNGNLSRACTGANCSTSSESGILGADAICQTEANSHNIRGKYKAVLLSDNRYPCDANGVCDESHMSNWVIHANTAYNNLANTLVATSNAQAVLPQLSVWPSYADGSAIPNQSVIYTGISVGRVNLAKTDIDAWSPFDINNSVSGYTANNCKNWTSDSPSDSAICAYTSSWFATSGDALGWYAGWGNTPYAFSQWVNSSNSCAGRLPLICVQQ